MRNQIDNPQAMCSNCQMEEQLQKLWELQSSSIHQLVTKQNQKESTNYSLKLILDLFRVKGQHLHSLLPVIMYILNVKTCI